jgi:hypothetical protein
MRVLISGMVAGDPGQGGASWAVLQYVLGFAELGHDVALVEPVDGERLADPATTGYFRDVVERFGLTGRAALLERGGTSTVGGTYDELRRIAERSDVLVNISGMLADEELRAPPATRVWLDLDPAFNQLWHAAEGIDMGFAGHTHFVTVGQAIGRAGCAVPTCGLDWIATLPPVVLSHWPPAGDVTSDALTTVGNWRGYGSVKHDGVTYGQKAHSLRRLWPLPGLSGERFLLALAIHEDEKPDLESLHEHGWELADAQRAAGTPDRYAAFVRGSRAEFGLAKSGYVLSRCGWFGDRSACYLASGRPVLAQDTGFGRALPPGEGLLAFSTVDEALGSLEELASDYRRHARAARRLAEERLDARTVLSRLLAAVGVAA